MLLFIWFIAIFSGLAALVRALLITYSDEIEFRVPRGSVLFGMVFRIVVMCVAIALIIQANQ